MGFFGKLFGLESQNNRQNNYQNYSNTNRSYDDLLQEGVVTVLQRLDDRTLAKLLYDEIVQKQQKYMVDFNTIAMDQYIIRICEFMAMNTNRDNEVNNIPMRHTWKTVIPLFIYNDSLKSILYTKYMNVTSFFPVNVSKSYEFLCDRIEALTRIAERG